MELTTQRLLIRTFKREDVDQYADIVADWNVVRFLGNGEPHSRERAQNYVFDCIAREKASGISRYAVLLKNSEKLIGFSGFKQMEGYVDFGYRFAFDQWRHGIATEAGRAVINFGFNKFQIDQIIAGVMPENLSSMKVLDKLGFSKHTDAQNFDKKFRWYVLPRSKVV
ncbi:MAG: GNAT family N-acetyltransferase [Parasphingorhabdus sp.]|uniref:GNAT family N-acetyltransferase n=1 Tax=Parasphingorhabdus sp. TaxID=2709688 RepID=UPI003298674B